MVVGLAATILVLSRFETDTPNATASVQGTRYVVWIHPDGTEEFWVLEGEIVVETETEDG